MGRRASVLASVLVMGSFLVSGGPAAADLAPGTLHLWMRDAQLWSLSPNGRYGAVTTGSGVGGLRVVDMSTRREIAGPNMTGPINALAVDDQGRLFVSTNASLALNDFDGKIDGYRFDLPDLTPHPVTERFANIWDWSVIETSSTGGVLALHATNDAIGDQAAFRYDVATDTLTQPDLLFDAAPGTTPQSMRPTLSGDGSRMAYAYFDVVGCAICRHAYVYDAPSNTNRLVDATNVGKPAKGNVLPEVLIAEGGDHVFFSSPGFDTAVLDTSDVRVLQLSTGEVNKGIANNGTVYGISADGGRVVYDSTDLGAGNPSMKLLDISDPAVRLLSDRFAQLRSDPATRPLISPDGSAVYFGFTPTLGDGAGTHNVYVRRAARAVPGFVAAGPSRLMDTRIGAQTIDGVAQGIGARRPGQRLELQVTGRAGIPTGARAVSLNVTATNAIGQGYATLWPCDSTSPPNASNLNYVAGQTVANSVIVGLSSAGRVCIQVGEGTTDLIVDVTGVLQTTADFVPVVPARMLDTRAGSATIDDRFEGGGEPAAGTRFELQITGRAGVPASARTVVLNMAATGHRGAGYLTVWPCDTPTPPNASNLNYVAGQTAANLVVAMVSPQGTVCLQTSASTNLIADLSGYFLPGSIAEPFTPRRVVDTRPGGDTVTDRQEGIGRRAADQTYQLNVGSYLSAAVLNVTVTDPTGPGYLTVWPCDSVSPPNASSLNFVAGQTVANLVIASVPSDGRVCYRLSGARAHVIIDHNGGLID